MENNENLEIKQEQQTRENEAPQSTNSNQTAVKTKIPFYKKWWFWVIIGVLAIGIIAGSGSSDKGDSAGEQGSPAGSSVQSSNLGDYSVVIESCRLAQDYQGKPIVIVKYKFTNNTDDPAAFWTSIEDAVYQNGVGLNECYVTKDSANYSSENQMKEIKKGVTIDVEVAYILNDTTTPIDVEVAEYFSLNDKKVTKTFTIN